MHVFLVRARVNPLHAEECDAEPGRPMAAPRVER